MARDDLFMHLTPLNQILAQDHAISGIKKRLGQKTFKGSFLFTGPDGVGKRTTALAVAAALFCQTIPKIGCGKCKSCQQVAAGTHPDLFLLTPDDKEAIKIDAARKMIRQMNLQPIQGDLTMAIIHRCDALTIEACNALLKSVEEHTGIYILTTSRPGLMPSTLRSRCQEIPFRPLPPPILRELLQSEFPEETIGDAIRMAEGSLNQARQLVKWLREMEIGFPNLFRELATKPYAELEKRLGQLSTDPREMTSLFMGLRAVCRDLVILASKSCHSPFFKESEKLNSDLGGNRDLYLQCLSAIDQAERALSQRASPLLLWETLAFSFQKVLKGIHVS